jgi:hypothetical protein
VDAKRPDRAAIFYSTNCTSRALHQQLAPARGGSDKAGSQVSLTRSPFISSRRREDDVVRWLCGERIGRIGEVRLEHAGGVADIEIALLTEGYGMSRVALPI